MAKKYYWLKLKQDFFSSRAMKKLRRIAGGDTYTIIYLKLQLLSIKDDGVLFYEGIEPTFGEEMALALDEDVENVQATLIFLENAGLMKKSNDVEFVLTEVPNLLGGEDDSTERVRRFRERQKLKGKEDVTTCNVTCNDDVTECNVTCNTEKRREDIDLELEKDKKRGEERKFYVRSV